MKKIQMKHISFAYEGSGDGNLKNLDFTIQAGECIVLAGRSGCGKTTVTRLFNGLIPEFFAGKLEGSAYIDEENLADKQLYEIAEKAGSVFQNPKTQFFHTDTDGEIAFGMENSGIPRKEIAQRVQQTAKALKIEHLLKRSIFSLSGGEKQKIAFASVYAMNPDVYLLDEPSSNLDTEAIRDLSEYIAILKKQGKTILIAEHRLYYLRDLADRIFYMEKGELKQIWSQEEFCNLSDKKRMQFGLRTFAYKEPRITEKNAENEKFVLELTDLAIGYGKKTVLSKIQLKAAPGDIIAITGRNGVGKSTFLRTLCGLQKALGGVVRWNGNEQNEKERLEKTYMVMQDVNYQLFADSVEHECYFGIKNPDRKLVEQTLKGLRLYPYKDSHPNTLSGGQKQRIAVAVSMICKKEILVFDEPTSGLDYESMCAVSDLMKTLAGMGKIIFLVTHDFEFITHACNRMIRLEP